MTTVREAVIALLRAHGMTTVFGNPGSTEMPLFRDWPDDFRYVLGLQESVVVGMADGYAQSRGNAAFVNLHAAAGVGHALGNIYTAACNNTPLVITAGQQARSLLATEPFLSAKAAAEFPHPHVKWAIETARPEDTPAAIARAYHIAMQEPRGPTFVSVPQDDWDAPCEPMSAREVLSGAHPSSEAITRIAALLAEAARPVIVIGADVDRAGAFALMAPLAERLNARVWASPNSARCSFPERHVLFAGFLPANRKSIADQLSGHDLVLVLGAPAFTYHVVAEGPFLQEGTRLVQITSDPDQAAWTPEGLSLVANVAAATAQLLKQLPARDGRAPAGREGIALAAASDPPSVDFLFDAIERTRPRNSIIVEEAPSSRLSFRDRIPIETPGGFIATGSGGLGFGLPAAVGVALAEPRRKVIAVIGDGSMMYAIQALWTAAQWRLPITVIVVNNRCYLALKRFGARFNVSPVGVDLPGLDFEALARGHGCDAMRVTRAVEIEPALRAAFTHGGPMLVDVSVTAR